MSTFQSIGIIISLRSILRSHLDLKTLRPAQRNSYHSYLKFGQYDYFFFSAFLLAEIAPSFDASFRKCQKMTIYDLWKSQHWSERKMTETFWICPLTEIGWILLRLSLRFRTRQGVILPQLHPPPRQMWLGADWNSTYARPTYVHVISNKVVSLETKTCPTFSQNSIE